MDEENLEKKIYLQKLSFLYSELPKAVLATLFIGLILVLILRGDVSDERLLIWYFLTFLVSLFRFYIFFRFKRDEKRDDCLQKYDRLIFVGTTMSALLWGASAVYIFPESDELKLIVIFCIAGLSAGATGSLSSLFKVYATFVLVSIVPFIIVFGLDASSYSLFISAALIFYLIAISSTALKINQNYDETLHLGFKNDYLVQELKVKADLAEQANEAKSMFLSTMSHEIRTPLNAIMGYISILRKNEKDKIKQHQLEIIDNSSHLLLGVINDVLDFNKITKGQLRLEQVQCDLKKEIEQLIELFLPLCKEKDITLEHEIDKTIPFCVLTDVLRLNQVLTNLLSNAVKFTSEGKKVVLKCRYEKPKIYFEVIDKGIGIDPEQQKIIFDRFQQADSSTTRKYGGTGLGLAISSQLVLLFGSKLEVVSVLNEGSTFFFNVKVGTCEEIQEKQPSTEVCFNHEKVLVAEDNKTNQMLIRLLLEDLNLDVEMVDDGKKAVEVYQDTFALVLMDINMPNMNGTEAMQVIKKNHPHSIIVALTANAMSEDKENYIDLGFDAYLSKPIDTEALIKALERLILLKKN